MERLESATTLPPLLLQPLVKNAIKHGLEPKIDGGHIAVSAVREDGQLRLCIADSGLRLNGQAQPRERNQYFWKIHHATVVNVHCVQATVHLS